MIKRYRKIIQLELNEISREVIGQLIAKGELPNFGRLEREWGYVATTSESEYDKLEPWIQWVTAHTGKTYAEHGIFRLSDAQNLEVPQLWETLSARGIESGIIGSMNATRGNTEGGMFFPDPWAKENMAHPASLKPLWSLISSRVQGHATGGLGVGDLLRGARSMLQYKLPPGLYVKIGRQLVTQKLKPTKKWQLAGYFDLLLYELFDSIRRSTDFGYYTLFLNAVAHYQHHYWRNFDRSDFAQDITYPDIGPNDDPMTFGYRMYDRILGHLLNVADEDTLVIVASGLTQVPYTAKEKEGGMNYYRLNDHNAFADLIGLAGEGYEVFPLMSRDWQIGYAGETERKRILETLGGLRVGDQPLFTIKENTPGFVFIETAYTRRSDGQTITDASGKMFGAFDQFFTNIAIKSGHHSGTGHVWMSDAAVAAAYPEGRMPLTE